MSELEFEEEKNLPRRTSGSPNQKLTDNDKSSGASLLIFAFICFALAIFLVYYTLNQSNHQPVPNQSVVLLA